MCSLPARRPHRSRSPCEIGPQPRFVDLPVAVLTAVEKNDGQPVAELGAQLGIRCGSDVDIDARHGQPELLAHLLELFTSRRARAASGADEEGDVVGGCGRACGTRTGLCHSPTVPHRLRR